MGMLFGQNIKVNFESSCWATVGHDVDLTRLNLSTVVSNIMINITALR